MTLQARCLSQQYTAPLTLYNAHTEHGAKCSEPCPLNETLTFLCKLIPLLYDLGAFCLLLHTKQNCSICILGLGLLANNFIGYLSKIETLQCTHLIASLQRPPTLLRKRQQYIEHRWIERRTLVNRAVTVIVWPGFLTGKAFLSCRSPGGESIY